MNGNRERDWCYFVLRVGLSLVILWFGINQLVEPVSWEGFVPDSFREMSYEIVIVNGLFEIVAGLMLIVGIYPRFVSMLLSINMVFIIIELGYSSIAVRDIGLLAGFIAIALYKNEEAEN